jgi:hypothetical protein
MLPLGYKRGVMPKSQCPPRQCAATSWHLRIWAFKQQGRVIEIRRAIHAFDTSQSTIAERQRRVCTLAKTTWRARPEFKIEYHSSAGASQDRSCNFRAISCQDYGGPTSAMSRRRRCRSPAAKHAPRGTIDLLGVSPRGECLPEQPQHRGGVGIDNGKYFRLRRFKPRHRFPNVLVGI